MGGEGEEERSKRDSEVEGRGIERVAMGWMISPCLQGYTLQLYHRRTGRATRGGAGGAVWKGGVARDRPHRGVN